MNMKFIKKIFTIISIIMTFCLCSCQNEAFSNADALTVSDSTAILTLNIDNGAGRSAVPDLDFSDLTWIELFAINTDVSDDYGRIIGEWRTIEELNVAKINIPVGRYTFTMSCDTAGVFFSDKQTVAVTAGSNALTFRPRLAFADTITGRGNLNVTITYPTDGIAAVTGGLYTLDGENAGSSYIDEDLTTDLTTDGGCSTYSKTGVSCGEYLVVFRFYGDAEKTLLRGIYREYCWLTNGKTSSSNCSISSVPGLFSITFEKNGGMFAGGSTVPGSYTRFSDTVTLPTADTITKAGSTFGGWYDNEGLTGEPVTQIPSGSIGNKTYYAKWIENAAVTFDKNDAEATITTSAQSVQKGVETNLLTAAVLGLVNNGKRFFGWAEASDGAVKYYDGDAITLTEDKTLYAIWSATAINPGDENDTTDTDGDGLTDWDELHTYFTDPSNPDTDGDGWSDGDEIEMRKQNANAFSPLIADVPAVEVVLTEKPIIEYVYQLADYMIGTVTAEDNDGTIGSIGNNKTNTKSYNETHIWSVNYGGVQQWGKDGAGYEITEQTSYSNSQYSGSIANSDSYVYSSDAVKNWSVLWINGVYKGKDKKQVTGGRVRIKFKLKNPCKIDYELNKVTVAFNSIPIGTTEASVIASISKAFIGKIDSEGKSKIYTAECQLSVASLEKLMKWSAGITAEVTGYEISVDNAGYGSKDYNKDLNKIKSQTAALFIDYGNGSTATYNIAAKNQFNKDSATVDDMYIQNDLAYVFNNILDMSGDYTVSAEGYIKSINGIANAADARDGAWYIGHKYTEDGKRYLKTYSPYTGGDDKTHWTLSDINISAGDEISIIYVKDGDSDGVPLNEEIMYGTDDTKSDTDGDGLTDYEEIYGWYKSGIGLDAKYSDSNKVRTNPKITDTDGDSLLDYSEDSYQRDSDSLVWTAGDASLSICRYATVAGDNFTDVTFDNEDKCTIAGTLGDRLYLDAVPSNPHAAVRYRLGTDGEYKDINKNEPIIPGIGENDIYILCTASDGMTSKEYVLTVNSSFNMMCGFTVSSPELRAAYKFQPTAITREPAEATEFNVDFNWNTYDDARADVSLDGGYVLYAKKGADLWDNIFLSRDNAADAINSDIVKDIKDYNDLFYFLTVPEEHQNICRNIGRLDEFYIRLTLEDLAKGVYALGWLPKRTAYCFYLFAFTGARDEQSYKCELLASASVRTGKSQYANLNIYAHYIYALEDHDGGYKPDYYWQFGPKSRSTTTPLNLFYLDCDVNNRKEFDDDGDNKSWCFGKTEFHKYKHDTAKFSGCTIVLSTLFDRVHTHFNRFNVTWEAWEYDGGSGNDKLGKVTALFEYTRDTDTWTCSWSSTCGASGTSAISTGQRSGKNGGGRDDGNRWELHNTDKGEIEFHWDWGWDED